MSRADLAAQRDALLESLRDLEAERAAGDLDEGDYQALRDDYTARAASVIRALDEHEARQPGSPADPGPPEDAGSLEDAGSPEDAGPARSTPVRSRKVVAVVLIAGFALTGALGVAFMATDRGEDGLTGSLPTTVAGLLARAHELEAQGQALDALRAYDAVLDQDPGNVEALAYRGWLLRLAGLTDEAEAFLGQALAIDPGYPDARFFRGVLLLRDRSDSAGALADFEVFLAAAPPPELEAAVNELVEQARALAGAGPADRPAG